MIFMMMRLMTNFFSGRVLFKVDGDEAGQVVVVRVSADDNVSLADGDVVAVAAVLVNRGATQVDDRRTILSQVRSGKSFDDRVSEVIQSLLMGCVGLVVVVDLGLLGRRLQETGQAEDAAQGVKD